MSNPADNINNHPLPTGSIERSIGWLLAGIGVILFFFLTLLGMGRMEQIATEPSQLQHGPANKTPTSEIVGVATE